MRYLFLLSLVLLGCSSESDPPPVVPKVIPRPPIRTSFTLSWAEAVSQDQLQTGKASKDYFFGETDVPGFGVVTFRYHNPHPAVDMSAWNANKAPVFRSGFNPPNQSLSYTRLMANSGPPFESFQLVLGRARFRL